MQDILKFNVSIYYIKMLLSHKWLQSLYINFISLENISINTEKEGNHIFSRHNPIFVNKKNQHVLSM